MDKNQPRKARKKKGRPSTYCQRYCSEIVRFMARGMTMTAFAGSIGVCRDTVQEWGRAHPNFSAALKRGTAARVAYWERRLLKAGNKRGDATPVIFALKNACPDEWRDVQRIEHTGKDGGPVETHNGSLGDVFAELARRGAGLPSCGMVPITHRS